MGHSTHRLAFQRLSRLICPESFLNCLIPSRRPEINGSLKRQLSYLNSKSVVIQSRFSGISSTSAQWSKVIQGHRLLPFTFAENVPLCRSFSSVEHGCSQVWVLNIFWTQSTNVSFDTQATLNVCWPGTWKLKYMGVYWLPPDQRSGSLKAFGGLWT